MEIFTEVVELLKQAYIVGAGNPNIGPADGRITRIGAIIVELSSPQVLFEAQREAQQIRENTPQTPQKKSPVTPMERKPSASLMNARENPVLQNMSGKAGVAGNPYKGYAQRLGAKTVDVLNMGNSGRVASPIDKPKSNAKQVRLPDEEMNRDFKRSEIGLEIENKFDAPTKGKTFMTAEFEIADGVIEASDKHLEAIDLTGRPDEIAMLESEFKENTRLLTEAHYKGKTPKYVAENFSQYQIEATLKSLGIDFDPAMSVKQKAAHLVKSVK